MVFVLAFYFSFLAAFDNQSEVAAPVEGSSYSSLLNDPFISISKMPTEEFSQPEHDHSHAGHHQCDQHTCHIGHCSFPLTTSTLRFYSDASKEASVWDAYIPATFQEKLKRPPKLRA